MKSPQLIRSSGRVIAGLMLSAALLGLTAQQNAMAQEGAYGPLPGDWEVTLGGGGSNNKDFDTGAGNVNGSIGYYFTENLELSLRQGISYADADNAESSWAGSSRIALDYHFNLERWRPFLGVNFGGFYGENLNDSWAAGLEAGVKYYVMEKTFIFGMAEYAWAFNDADEADDAFDDGQFIYSLGLGFNF